MKGVKTVNICNIINCELGLRPKILFQTIIVICLHHNILDQSCCVSFHEEELCYLRSNWTYESSFKMVTALVLSWYMRRTMRWRVNPAFLGPKVVICCCTSRQLCAMIVTLRWCNIHFVRDKCTSNLFRICNYAAG